LYRQANELNQFITKGINMKFTKKLLIASTLSAMTMLSTQAFADDISYANETVLTADASSKAVAFEQGISALNGLQAASSNDLEQKFWWLGLPANNMTLEEGAYVTVAEKMTADGQLVYNGIVHASVAYESDENEQDND